LHFAQNNVYNTLNSIQYQLLRTNSRRTKYNSTMSVT